MSFELGGSCVLGEADMLPADVGSPLLLTKVESSITAELISKIDLKYIRGSYDTVAVFEIHRRA